MKEPTRPAVGREWELAQINEKNDFFLKLYSQYASVIDKSSKVWYNVHATQTAYFFSDTGKYFGKKCFLSFLIPYRREFV